MDGHAADEGREDDEKHDVLQDVVAVAVKSNEHRREGIPHRRPVEKAGSDVL
jgi:hypothetical protein